MSHFHSVVLICLILALKSRRKEKKILNKEHDPDLVPETFSRSFPGVSPEFLLRCLIAWRKLQVLQNFPKAISVFFCLCLAVRGTGMNYLIWIRAGTCAFRTRLMFISTARLCHRTSEHPWIRPTCLPQATQDLLWPLMRYRIHRAGRWGSQPWLPAPLDHRSTTEHWME